VLTAAKALAQRVKFLEQQRQDLTAQLDGLVGQINPALRAAYGVGPHTAAQLLVTAGTNPHRLRSEASFAALCGAAPVPASSGTITRHRLSRGGDRAANNALHRIALVRMSAHPQTRGYVQRQLANGRTNKEILRLLKRAIAREIFRLLTRRTRSTNTAAPYTAGGSWARCHRLHVGHRGSTTVFLHDAGRSLSTRSRRSRSAEMLAIVLAGSIVPLKRA